MKSRTQAEIDEQRSAMAQEIVDSQPIGSFDEAKRFAKAWIETAAQHASNESYYYSERNALLRLLVDVRPMLNRCGDAGLLARVDERVREARLLLEPNEP